jgi:hypothetical protein
MVGSFGDGFNKYDEKIDQFIGSLAIIFYVKILRY